MSKFRDNLGHFVAMFIVSWVFWMVPTLLISLYQLEWWSETRDYAVAAAFMSFVIAFAYGFMGFHEDFKKDDW